MIDRLSAMRVLVSAVDRGSLAAAARVLRLSPAKASRLIAALEAQVGTTLLHRTTRRLRLSEAGVDYAEACRRVLADIDEADRRAAGEHGSVRGTLTLTAPVAAGTRILLPILDIFLDTHPEVRARLMLVDRLADLVDEGIDIALRIAHLPDSSLIAVRVGETRLITCAAPSYLARMRPIERPADLADQAAILLAQSRMGETWQYAAGERPETVAVRPRLVVNSIDAAFESIVAGHGVGRLLSYQVAEAIHDGRLTRLLPDFEPTAVPVHLVAPRSALSAAKTRSFLDLAAPLLRERFASI